MDAISESPASARWLEAPRDVRACLFTRPRCLALADLQGHVDRRLVAAHIPQKHSSNSGRLSLKVFKGTSQTHELPLQDIPCAVVSLPLDDSGDAAVAVASNSDILVFRNLKPYFKWSLPSLEILPLEVDVWAKLSLGNVESLNNTIEPLKSIAFTELTSRSRHLLTIPSDQRPDFVALYASQSLVRRSVITCMQVLHRNPGGTQVASLLVVATEHGDLTVIDTQAFTSVHEARVSPFRNCPSLLSVIGYFDLDYRCIIATREDTLCVVRKGWLEGRTMIRMGTPIVAMEILPTDQSILVALMDKTLACYSRKGRRLWFVHLAAPVSAMCLISLPHLGTSLACVALHGGAIQSYNGRHLVDSFNISETVSALTFGALGQEDNVLAMATDGGAMLVKILKRTADFSSNKSDSNTAAAIQAKPLQLPKKTKLFVEQSLREREQASDIHQIFQQELWRLRLSAARAAVEALRTADVSVALSSAAPIKLSAQVLGLGPAFRLVLQLRNLSHESPVAGLQVLIHCDHLQYQASDIFMQVPLLAPGVSYKLETRVAVVTELSGTEGYDVTVNVTTPSIRVLVLREGQSGPLIAATVHMPPPEM